MPNPGVGKKAVTSCYGNSNTPSTSKAYDPVYRKRVIPVVIPVTERMKQATQAIVAENGEGQTSLRISQLGTPASRQNYQPPHAYHKKTTPIGQKTVDNKNRLSDNIWEQIENESTMSPQHNKVSDVFLTEISETGR